jgi:hypothetical protein
MLHRVDTNGKGRHRPAAQPVPPAQSPHPAPSAEYIEVQRGFPLVAAHALSSLMTLSLMWLAGPHLLVTMILLPQLFCMVCFCTLRIRVTHGWLLWRYGPGWIRRRLPLSQIESVNIVMTPFTYGWGFRRTLHGWRFNRLGSLAVEIRCQDGKRLRLGTPRALELQRILTPRNECS